MNFLDFLYALARSTQKSETQNAIRYVPFMALMMVLFGFFHAVLVLISRFPAAGEFLSRPLGFRQVDLGFFLAAVLASLVTLFCFDKRREQIDAAFRFIPPSSSEVHPMGVGLLTVGGGAMLLVLSVHRPVAAIALFLSICLLGSFVVRKFAQGVRIALTGDLRRVVAGDASRAASARAWRYAEHAGTTTARGCLGERSVVALMQQRYYDPAIGRFLSVDPVPTNPNTGGNFARYCYANNNHTSSLTRRSLCLQRRRVRGCGQGLRCGIDSGARNEAQ